MMLKNGRLIYDASIDELKEALEQGYLSDADALFAWQWLKHLERIYD